MPSQTPLADALNIKPGLTAMIGSGGKTSLIARLARELSCGARVIACTSTHIFPFPAMTVVTGGRDELSRALDTGAPVCAGTVGVGGRFTASAIPFEEMKTMADYVLVEADGARLRPLKAHASHEPAVPECADRVIFVVGADGIGRPIREAAHRSELYARLIGADEGHIVTPGDAAKALGAYLPRGTAVFNKAELPGALEAGRAFAKAYMGNTVITSLASKDAVREVIEKRRVRVLIRGAGDLATGVALRLHRANMDVVMTDIPVPTAVRRTVSISRAIYENIAAVEDVTGVFAPDAAAALRAIERGRIPVLIDPAAKCREELCPDVLVDAIIAKRNTGTRITDAPVVVGLGPGFTAGEDCSAAIETMRGHDLGRALYSGSPAPNTGVPGEIGGEGIKRLLRAPCAGVFCPAAAIGDIVEAGTAVAHVEGMPVTALIGGVVRGMLQEGVRVAAGMKCGDIDPRAAKESCFTVSDKARAIGGGVLEAILHFLPMGAEGERTR